MSHTTSIASVVVTDISALRAAIEELRREGIRCELLENAVPRAYFSNQQGMGPAPYVVKVTDAKYDVGLYPVEGKQNEYTFSTDFYGGTVQNILGTRVVGEGETQDQAKLGKLAQRYAVCAAERQAIQQGFSADRTTGENGSIQLTLTTAA